jgi:hypothetical protein
VLVNGLSGPGIGTLRDGQTAVGDMNKPNLFPIKLPQLQFTDTAWDIAFVIGLGAIVVINMVSIGVLHGWW